MGKNVTFTSGIDQVRSMAHGAGRMWRGTPARCTHCASTSGSQGLGQWGGQWQRPGVLAALWPCQMACAPSSAQHQEGPWPLPSTAGAWQMQTPSLVIAFVWNSRLTRKVIQEDCFLCQIWFYVSLILTDLSQKHVDVITPQQFPLSSKLVVSRKNPSLFESSLQAGVAGLRERNSLFNWTSSSGCIHYVAWDWGSVFLLGMLVWC